MNLRLALVTTLVASTAGSRADAEGFGYVGFALAHQSSHVETPHLDMRFSNNYLSLESYGIFAPIYVKMSHGLRLHR